MFPTRKPGLPALFFTTVFVFSVASVNDTWAGIPNHSIPIGSDNFTSDTLTGEPDRHYHLVEEIDLGRGQWSPPLWFNASPAAMPMASVRPSTIPSWPIPGSPSMTTRCCRM